MWERLAEVVCIFSIGVSAIDHQRERREGSEHIRLGQETKPFTKKAKKW